METSDSDCFESAEDEDFNSDDKQKASESPLALQNCVTFQSLQLENSSISPTRISRHGNESQEVSSIAAFRVDKPNSTIQLQSNHNSHAESYEGGKIVNKSSKRSKLRKLTGGVKLGTKLKTNSTSECVSDKCSLAKDKENKYEGNNITELKKEAKNSNLLGCNSEANMWEEDDWEPIENATNKLTEKSEKLIEHQLRQAPNNDDMHTGWSTNWGSWGVASLLSTATTITNQVSQSITTALENGIGVPDPEELARLHNLEKKQQQGVELQQQMANTTSDLTFGIGSIVSGVTQITKLVETTGNKVISSSLDTLETIGKKTMEVLQDGDPGLKKKRSFLKIETEKPVLSNILREAKEKSEDENTLLADKPFLKKPNYEALFDDHQGLVHLEALEMLSKQCCIKLQNLLESNLGNNVLEMQETINQVQELCELTEDEDENMPSTIEIKDKLDGVATEMNIPVSYNKLVKTWLVAEERLENIDFNICDEIELHEWSINILAQLTAIAVEQFHKTGELLLIKEHRSTVDEADSLVQLTLTITFLIGNVAKKMCGKLNEKASDSENKEQLNRLITNIYYEATNSSSYIKDAFQLLIPVLQVGAIALV